MNKKKWIGWTIVIVLLTNALTLFGSNLISLSLPNGKVLISREDFNQVLKFEKMFQIRNILYKYYDGKIEDDTLVEGAIKGMTSSLNDPYTVFMDEKEYSDFNAQTEGNYSGVGLQVQAKEQKILIVDVFEDSPAKKAGVLPKDEIEKVDDKPVSGQELDKAVSLMKGEEGTEVKITLYREGTGNYDIKVKRQKINFVTVKGEMLKGSIGYIQIAMFDENTGKNLKNKLNELKEKGMKSLVIDLRGNPGGLLDECVDMLSNFIPKGKKLVYTIDKNKKEEIYNSSGGDFVGLPLVILTNEGSASASEIFAGAIRDYKVGTLVGEKTFGKGVVQTLIKTGEGTALKVTISKYYTPNGENIHHIGIKPDMEVVYPQELLKKPYDRSTDPQLTKAIQVAKEKAEGSN